MDNLFDDVSELGQIINKFSFQVLSPMLNSLFSLCMIDLRNKIFLVSLVPLHDVIFIAKLLIEKSHKRSLY